MDLLLQSQSNKLNANPFLCILHFYSGYDFIYSLFRAELRTLAITHTSIQTSDIITHLNLIQNLQKNDGQLLEFA